MKRVSQIFVTLICFMTLASCTFEGIDANGDLSLDDKPGNSTDLISDTDDLTSQDNDFDDSTDLTQDNDSKDSDSQNDTDGKSTEDNSDFYDMGRWMGFDFEKLGVEPHTYDTTAETFELSENMQDTIANMYALCGDWNSSDVNDENWKDSFVQRFILNSWYSPEYLNGKDIVTKEEVEYVQYSLTGVRLFYPLKEGETIDRSEASSPINEVYMDSYSVSEIKGGYLVYASFITNEKYINAEGDVDVKEVYDSVSVKLIENIYSCFDGYSIDSISMAPPMKNGEPDFSYGCKDIDDALRFFILNPEKVVWDKSPEMDYKFDGYQLIDLDGDYERELIATISNPDNRYDYGIQPYVIVDFEDNCICVNETGDGVASAGGYRGDKYYIPGKGIIYDISYDAPYNAPGSSVYEYKKGILEQREYGYLSPNADYEYPKNLEIGTWYWCGNEVTEKDYETKLRTATMNFAGEPFNKIDFVDKEEILSLLPERS